MPFAIQFLSSLWMQFVQPFYPQQKAKPKDPIKIYPEYIFEPYSQVTTMSNSLLHKPLYAQKTLSPVTAAILTNELPEDE